MRTTLACLLALALTPIALAEFQSDRDFELNKEDSFNRDIEFTVKSVLDEDKMLVVGTRGSPSAFDPRTKRIIGGGKVDAVKPFVLRQSTDGVVDGRPITLKGRYRVVGTEKVGKRTVWVLEPAGSK